MKIPNSSAHCIRLQTHTNLVQHPRKLLNDLRERANKKKILYIQAIVFFKFQFQKVCVILTRIKPIPSIQKLFVAIKDFSDSVLWQQSSKSSFMAVVSLNSSMMR